MNQSKLESSIESTANIASGFLISLLMWVWVVEPLYASKVINSSIAIVTIFTGTSWLRSYFWRRFFNAGFHVFVQNQMAKRDFNRSIGLSGIWHKLFK